MKRKTELKFGLYAALSILIAIILGDSFKLYGFPIAKALLGLLVLGGFSFAYYKGIKTVQDNQNAGKISLGRGLSAGMLIALVKGILACLIFVIHSQIIYQGNTDASILQLILTVMGLSLIIGLILSLLVTVIIRW